METNRLRLPVIALVVRHRRYTTVYPKVCLVPFLNTILLQSFPFRCQLNLSFLFRQFSNVSQMPTTRIQFFSFWCEDLNHHLSDFDYCLLVGGLVCQYLPSSRDFPQPVLFSATLHFHDAADEGQV